ncbi:MAG: DEAD/DEAH box helicase family protein [Lachnospiraceae bacterium]|nr:DEAD/DEAH box helicase family protein [Lachnospiraceae bacterium]
MKEIKKKLKLYYEEKNHSLKIEQFILFEMALMIVVRFKTDADPNKGYLLFTKYHNIGKWAYDSDSYLLQNASICLKKFRSEKMWKDTLKEYKKDEYAGVRLFNILDDRIAEKDVSNLVYANRQDDYLRYIHSYSVSRSGKYATQGNYKYYNKNNEEKYVHVALHEEMDEDICCLPTEAKQREKIEVDVAKLLDAAAEMKKLLPEDPCETILKTNFIKEVSDGNVNPATKLVIDKVVDIVGMVGSGKTTLLKTLTYVLDRQKKKVVIVTDTVAEVFQLYTYFRSLGCSCSPLIGKAERIKYINQMISEDAYYLDEAISKYLTTNCLIDGLDPANENAVSFGEEPCTKLEKGSHKYVCPYFGQCTATAMQREATESHIVVSTVAGLVMSKVGELQDIYLKEVIDKADVVFFDECDRVQKNLDDLFTPATEFNAFINECAEDYHRFMLESNAKRLENIGSMYYAELQSKSPTVLACVSNAIKAAKNSGRKNAFSNTFSAYTLLDSIRDELSEHTVSEIYQLMDFDKAERSSLYDIMFRSCESIKSDRFEMLLAEWLDKNEPQLILEDVNKIVEENSDKSEKERRMIRKELEKKNRRNIELRKKIQLIITLIYFDKFVMDIGVAFEDSQDVTMGYNELVGFIRSRFVAQQDYLPSALMGNLFGLKSTKEDDVLLFKQYAYGRALLTNLPYLRVNREGAPVGPHVILLSGSSYAKGSYEYHVNADVNYIIEADPSVREFIAKTQFVELGLEERVSGSPLETKEEILRKVVDKCTLNIISELDKEGKILLVVNSFSQAEVVATQLRGNLIKRGCKEEVCTLVSDKSMDKGEPDQYIRRGEVYKFDKKKARILAAPALAIERGHNIVDEQGHSSLSSVFFLIRPMGVPDDVKEKSIKMNGYMAEKMYDYNGTDLYEKNLYIRKEAIKFWNRMNNSSKRRLDHLCDTEIRTDIVATMFVLILQIFGRLCRVTDASKNPPTVYFVDGAFRKRSDVEEGFDALNELYFYLKHMLSDLENGEIARTLYEPFFTAYEGGIRHE